MDPSFEDRRPRMGDRDSLSFCVMIEAVQTPPVPIPPRFPTMLKHMENLTRLLALHGTIAWGVEM